MSMSKPEEKRRAIDLRRHGLSYREIRQQVPVAKATLSLWLRSVGLSRPQRQRLTEKRLAAAQRGWEKLRRERLERVARTMAEAEQEAMRRLDECDILWIMGTVLYWAEGTKLKDWRTSALVEFSNTDLRMLLIAREWLLCSCGVDDSAIVYTLQIHQSADVSEVCRFWERHLHLTSGQIRTYLKRHNPAPHRKNTGTAYYGTIKMIVRRSTDLNHRIAGWIRRLAAHWGVG